MAVTAKRIWNASARSLGILGWLTSAACSRAPELAASERPVPAAHSLPPLAQAPPPASPYAGAALALPLTGHGAPGSKIKHVIVIAMENHDAEQIYSNTVDAPYLHSLLGRYAHTENFQDELPLEIPSEGHYVWMEAGTHRFSDAIFDDDSPPSPSVSTGSNKHLVRQIEVATTGISWMTYQEGLNAETGACPIQSSGFYAPKHNPFIFFRDVSGDPPAKETERCALHHRPYSALQDDLGSELASYVFITPDQCHDMHGQPGCPEENPIRTGDRWLEGELPRMIAYADRHEAVIFITFDEGGSTPQLPFIAIGPMVKPNYAGQVRYTHSSQLKSVEAILGLEALPAVANAPDLSDLFEPGRYP